VKLPVFHRPAGKLLQLRPEGFIGQAITFHNSTSAVLPQCGPALRNGSPVLRS
jgi:hypothetical protein